MIKLEIYNKLAHAIESLGYETDFSLDHPTDDRRGDFATNAALIIGKKRGLNPLDVATSIKEKLGDLRDLCDKVEVAPPGFINFYLAKTTLRKSVGEIIEKNNEYGRNNRLLNEKVLFEYTDPNPFKQFHIGHLMANSIGEAFSRLSEWNGAKVTRMCYGGDVGLHIGKTIYGMLEEKATFPYDSDSLEDKVKFISDAYVLGNNLYEDDADAKQKIEAINKEVFRYVRGEAVDEDIEVAYKKGKLWSLELFHEMYDLLGTKFDHEWFESMVEGLGVEKVMEGLKKGVFEESEGAVVYKGEKVGLHTRVFLNSHKLPTYEAKELGLVFKKFSLDNWHESVVVTGSEQRDYYKVFLAALAEIDLEKAKKTKHFTHGMLRFASGKMSSRKGNVIIASEFLKNIKEEVLERIKDRGYDDELKSTVANAVSIGAIKYVILRQSPGRDVVYDNKEALSFEGDSGPYLQYSLARAHSVLRKADQAGIIASITGDDLEISMLERKLYIFGEVVERAGREYSPQYLTTYLTELAGVFNSWYGSHIIVSEEVQAPYRVALTKAFVNVMTNGLNILAIPTLERM